MEKFYTFPQPMYCDTLDRRVIKAEITRKLWLFVFSWRFARWRWCYLRFLVSLPTGELVPPIALFYTAAI